MTNPLSTEQSAALVAAYENGGRFSDSGASACVTFPRGIVAVDDGGKLVLANWGRIIAQLCKQVNELRRVPIYQAWASEDCCHDA